MLLNILNYIIIYLYNTYDLIIKYLDWNIFRIFNCLNNTVFTDDFKTYKSLNEYLFQLYKDIIN